MLPRISPLHFISRHSYAHFKYGETEAAEVKRVSRGPTTGRDGTGMRARHYPFPLSVLLPTLKVERVSAGSPLRSPRLGQGRSMTQLRWRSKPSSEASHLFHEDLAQKMLLLPRLQALRIVSARRTVLATVRAP